MLSLFGFAPGGVYLAITVTSDAVGSYSTLSPLPTVIGGLLSVALSLGLPPPDVIRHRVSMEPGLSSPDCFRDTGAITRPTGDPGLRTSSVPVKLVVSARPIR